MPMIEWNDDLSVKIDEIDTQHKSLVEVINRLYDSMQGKVAAADLLDIITELREYTNSHFDDEENLMDLYAYPGTKHHKANHLAFVEKITQVENDYKNGKNSLSMDILNFLSHWLVTHINGTDKTLGTFLSGKGVS